jgi:hypothetical protein
MKQPPLFEAQHAGSTAPLPPRMRDLVTVKCNGCPVTGTEVATRHAAGWPHIPFGWCVCGETSEGALALWCGQCQFEGKGR